MCASVCLHLCLCKNVTLCVCVDISASISEIDSFV